MRRLIVIAFCLTMADCAAERKPGELFGPVEERHLVVDALLIVNHPLPDLFVHQTIPPGTIYTREGAAVTDAVVEVRQGSQTFRYRADPDSLGRYLPPENAPLVMPDTEYHLTVLSEGQDVSAATRTPERFHLREVVLLDEKSLEVKRGLKMFADGEDLVFTAPENQVIYQDGVLEARFQPMDVSGYQAGIFSLDPGSERVLEADFLDESDYAKLKRQESSPAFEAPNGLLRLPWFAVAFAGRHLIKIYALDKNWFDFVRSSPENDEGTFGNLAGDRFERPLFRVDGGIGLFGSAAMDSLGFVIHPKQ